MNTYPDYGAFICPGCYRCIERAHPLAEAIAEAERLGRKIEEVVEI